MAAIVVSFTVLVSVLDTCQGSINNSKKTEFVAVITVSYQCCVVYYKNFMEEFISLPIF